MAAHTGVKAAPVEWAVNGMLFLIYTSGTTGEPKRVEHVTGGYLVYIVWTSQTVLDLDPEGMYLYTTSIGWVSSHPYATCRPLALGMTAVTYEGMLNYLERGRIWDLIEENAVDVLCTAPTAIRSFMKWDASLPASWDLSSLCPLGAVGEPIDPQAWHWYYEYTGNGNCPIVDIWRQTETSGVMIMTSPGVEKMEPSSAGPPFPGVGMRVVDGCGEEIPTNEVGYLALMRPWPRIPLALRHGHR